jgi:hypothetical protein
VFRKLRVTFLGVVLANNDGRNLTLALWFLMLLTCAWAGFKLWKASRFSFLINFNIALACTITLCIIANWNISERLRPSYVFIHPGIWSLDGRWDLLVNHRGPKTSYGVQILFVDEDRLEVLRHSNQSLSLADVDSYQTMFSIPEVNPKGHGTIFAKQFFWRPFSPEKSHFTSEITWRDGRVHEDIRIVRVQGKWAYAMSVKDPETGTRLFDCKDANFPSLEALPSCFPSINSTD